MFRENLVPRVNLNDLETISIVAKEKTTGISILVPILEEKTKQVFLDEKK